MIYFFAKVKFFRFWPKTMDYNKVFWLKSRSFFVVILLPNGTCHEAGICAILLPLTFTLFHAAYIFNCSDHRSFFSLIAMATKKAHLFVVDTVRTNQMPNVTSLYQSERTARLAQFDNYPVPPEEFSFDVRVDTEIRRVGGSIYSIIGRAIYSILLFIVIIMYDVMYLYP